MCHLYMYKMAKIYRVNQIPLTPPKINPKFT